jgi:hypothetical protein
MDDDWRKYINKSTWQHRRMMQPEELLKEEAFTDFTVKVRTVKFRSHRLILASHSDYFHRLLLSGMREAQEGQIEFKAMEPYVFGIILDYIYSGHLDRSISGGTLTEVYFAANMLQMEDLEISVLEALVKSLSPYNCLSIKSRIDSMDILSSDPSKDYILKNLNVFMEETIRDHWSIIINSQEFLEFDIEAVCEVLDTKASFEEVTDEVRRFSFIQGDLWRGVMEWLSYDIEARAVHIRPRLSIYYCIHQMNMALKQKVELIYKFISESKPGKDCGSPAPWFRDDYDNITDLCEGQHCADRLIEGLLVVHGRTNVRRCLDAQTTDMFDNLMYSFCVPKFSSYPKWNQNQSIFKLGTLYVLKEFGEMSAGEEPFIVPNNIMPIAAKSESSMILTRSNDNRLCGMVLNGQTNKSQCVHHHSLIYNYCPTNLASCDCKENHWSFCYDSNSHIYLVTSCPVKDVIKKSHELQFDPCCSTFKRLKAPFSTHGSSSVMIQMHEEECVLLVGGYLYTPGNDVSVVYCSQELLEKDGVSGGHTVVTTVTGTYKEKPVPNAQLSIYKHSSHFWSTIYPWKTLPFEICDAAVVRVKDHLLVIGGFRLTHDTSLNVYFYQPQTDVWVMDLRDGEWHRGPSLPSSNDDDNLIGGYARGTAYSINDDLNVLYSGGVRLKKTLPDASNQVR